MNQNQKQESYYAILAFMQALNIDRLPNSYEINCQVSDNSEKHFYSDTIEIDLRQGYALLYYNLLNQYNLGNKINSNQNLFIWSSNQSVLSVEVGGRIFKFK